MRRNIILFLATLVASIAFGATPKYIFYFIGDGMGMAPVMAAVAYNRAVYGQPNLPLMMTFPVAGQVSTYSASSPVTDSAAAGTALATGKKTANGMLGVTPDTVAVVSIASVLKDNGYGVGLVTNVAPDDATPGAFYAHVANRGMRPEVDRDFASSGFDFLAGSALNGLKKKGKPTDVLDIYREKGIRVINGYDEYLADKPAGGRVVLLDRNPFQDGNTGYMIDSIPGMITLEQMTGACLAHLKTVSPDKLFMMVEGGNIDHALHGNDGATAISEIFNFNNALRIAYDFMLQHPDETLIVVTADHDTGGMSTGCEATGYNAHFDLYTNQKVSKEMFSDICKKVIAADSAYTWDDMKAYLENNFGLWKGVKLSDKETEQLQSLFTEVFERGHGEDKKGLYNNFNAFADKVFNVMSAKAGAGWTTPNHTGNPVPVYAVGPGSEIFGCFQDNTEIPRKIARLAGYSLPE